MRPIACAVAITMSTCGGSSSRTRGASERSPATLPELEARRTFAVGQLAKLARSGAVSRRAAAIRGLGRVGGVRAVAVLTELLSIDDAKLRAATARALGMAGGAKVEAALLAAHERHADAETRVAIVWALGRVGTAASLPALVASLGESAALRREAAVALGKLGRNKIAIGSPAIDALLAGAGHGDAKVRYGIAYALARAHPATPLGAREAAALLALAHDSDPEVGAVAVFGLVRRGAKKLPWELATSERDWRVRVALMGAGSSEHPVQRQRVLEILGGLATTADATSIHVLAAGLRSLARRERLLPAEARSVRELFAKITALRARHGAVASEAHCLAAALAVRAGADFEAIMGCGGSLDAGLPLDARRAMAAELIAAGFGGEATVRMGRMLALTSERDARVRGAVLAALAGLAELPSARDTVAGLATQALADREIEVAGAGVTLATALIEHGGVQKSSALAAALIGRGRQVTDDAELRVGVLGAIAKARLRGGQIACRLAMGDANVTVREAGRACMKTLTGQEPKRAAPRVPPPAPPVDPATVIGKRVTWHVRTSRGAIEIALDPALAPWHVAVITALTRKGFYDGLLWHRVVPGFVIQGGDPRGSGWGGPGFTIPGEPGGSFERGTVGIADAGMDTGGSQWFIMHARAPHLDGRYTAIGRVRRGQDVVDAIGPGDRIVRARVEVR